MAKVFRFQIGDLVQTWYRGAWIGRVLDRTKRNGANPLYEVQPIYDRCLRPQPKHVRPRSLDEFWLKPWP